MELLKALNVKAGCRLCLQVTTDLIPIFQEMDSNPNDSLSLPNRISACVGFVITQMEKLPSKICSNCIQEVDRWFVFQSRAQSTNSLLTKVAVEGYQLVSVSMPSTDSSPELSGKSTTALVVISEPKALSNAQKDDICSKPQSSIKEDNSGSASKDMVLVEPKLDTILDSALQSIGFSSDNAEEGDGGNDCGDSNHEADHASDSDSDSLSSLENSSDDDDAESAGAGQEQDGEAVSWRLKAVKCPVCHKLYSKYNSVKHHLRLHHTVLKFYPCVICGHASLKSTDRVKHIAKKHKDSLKKNTCDICGYHFKKTAGYRRHLKSHEEARRCGFCKLLLDSIEALEEHKKTFHQKELTQEPPPDVVPSYHCHHCENVSFWKKEDWKEHYLSAHNTEDIYPCNLCSKAFRSRRLQESHIRVHTGEKPFMCELCASRFVSKESLRQHMRKHTSKFECQECNKTYTSYSGLYHHLRCHKNPTSFVCHECGKQFKSAGGLEFHMRTHTGEKPFKCEHCDFTSRTNSGLYAHRVIHSDERPFKCDQCDKTFKMKSWLKEHKKTHTGIKNFVCDVCNHAFIAMYQLRSHLKTHSGERPHVCDICNKTFARRDTLTEHRRIHTKETKYTCEHCNAEFMFLKTFKRHKCPAMLVLFPQKSQLQPVTESLSDCLEDDDD